MNWIVIAIGAHFFWALVNIGDKHVIANKVKNPYVYMVWLAFLGILAAAIIPFVDFIIPTGMILFWLILGSALPLFSTVPYFKALQIEEVTRINIWWQMIPIFSFVIAWFVLDEKFNLNLIFAFALLVIGGIVASLHFKKGEVKFSRAFWLMVISCAGYAIYAVIFRYITQFIPFVSAFIWVSVLMGVYALAFLISKKFRYDFKNETKKLADRKFLSTVLGISLFDNLGSLFNIWALSLGPVALVFAMEGWQILFVFILALAISAYKPHILKEELDKKNLILKFTALILMIIGIIVINLG
jgi:uncharacterized membrane protein